MIENLVSKEGINMKKNELEEKIKVNELNLERLLKKKDQLETQIENLEHKIKNQKKALSIIE